MKFDAFDASIRPQSLSKCGLTYPLGRNGLYSGKIDFINSD